MGVALRAAALATVVGLCLPAGGSGQEASRPATLDLRDLFAHGFLLEDRNGDGHADFVNARFLVPTGAGDAELAAAANLAARISFESYGVDMDLLRFDGAEVEREGAPVVIVGGARELLGSLGITPETALRDLVAGEAAFIRLPPSAALPGGGVWVAGADATGLLGGAGYLAARYPAIWAPEGTTYEALGDALAEHLVAAGIETPRFSFERVVVSSVRPGVARISVVLHVESDEVRDAARAALGADGKASALIPEGLHRLDIRLTGGGAEDELHRIVPDRPWREGSTAAWQPRDVPDFTLSDLFTIRGIFRDTTQDLLPDRFDAHLSLRGGEGAEGVVNLAMRAAHEATGIQLPLVLPAGDADPPREAGFPILFGLDHFTTTRLRDEGRLGTPSGAEGEGFVEFVTKALDDRPALVVSGSDAAGARVAADLIATRFPYLHSYGKGEFRLSDVENEVRRFFQARGVAGQTALALVKLEEWLDRLEAGERPGVPASNVAGSPSGASTSADPPATLQIELGLDSIPIGLEAHLRGRISARFPGVPLEIQTEPSGFGAGEPQFDDRRTFPWEVDTAWEALRELVLPEVGPGSSSRIELRLSEPPEVRRALAQAIRDSVVARGAAADAVQVTVLSAYKQGFSWIEESVIPRLRGQAVARMEIRYHHLRDAGEIPWSIVEPEIRWLQELFPVEEIVARELGIPDTAVVFRADASPQSTYRLLAWDSSDRPLFDEGFDPSYVVRPYFEVSPEYERVRVATGRLLAEVDGESVADRRIPTDLELFWDYWLGEIHPRIRAYVMDLHEGRVTPGTAPFFDELRVEVRLSEPNHRIGVDEEVISALESLHNDLYFTTLALFAHLGGHYGVGALNYPGRIIPLIDPTGAGAPGEARVTLTGRSRAGPELVLRAPTEAGEVPAAPWRYPLSPLPTEVPKLRGAALRAGRVELDRLLFEVTAVDSVARWDEYRDRASESQVDRTFLSVEMLERMVDVMRGLHADGILEEGLSFEGVGEVAVRFRVERADDFERMISIPRSAHPLSTRNPVLASPEFRWGGERLTQWATPIPPPESDSILARIGTFPGAEPYFVGRSYLGKNLFAADFLPPIEARYRSQAKLTALRPTIFLSGRQHANEVSSTSHLLRLGELLVTDPEFTALLNRVNVVLNPILNADGAQLAYDLQQVNPDFTLHAGYLGALRVDVTAGGGSDPIYPESRVRPELTEAWLPDIFINMHGYPSHEWVQHFSGYAAWVRGRTVLQRTWWAPRGWFIPGFSWVDDPDHPEIRTAQFAILDTIAAAITGLPEIQAMSERQYAQYARYGRQDVDGFRETFHNGVLAYLSLRGRPATGPGPNSPRILTFSATTEAPDETARGEWLELVASAGLAHSSALIRYLATGDPRVERGAEAFDGVVTRRISRKRPVLPVSEEEEEEEGEGEGEGEEEG